MNLQSLQKFIEFQWLSCIIYVTTALYQTINSQTKEKSILQAAKNTINYEPLDFDIFESSNNQLKLM